MSNSNYIQDLLELKGIIVKQIKIEDKFNLVYIEYPVTTHICPNCCNKTSKIHDYRLQYIKDIPINLKPTFLAYKKRRYICPACNKKFHENNSLIGKYQHKSSRLNTVVINELMSESSQTSITRRYNISPSTVGRIIDYMHKNSFTQLPDVIAIDEFKGDTNFGKY